MGSVITPRDECSRYLTRKRNGDYLLPATNAGWAAWQARGLVDSAAGMASANWATDPKRAPKVLRDIQLKAAMGLTSYPEDSPAWVIFADIHRMAAEALQLKALPAPGDECSGS